MSLPSSIIFLNVSVSVWDDQYILNVFSLETEGAVENIEEMKGILVSL